MDAPTAIVVRRIRPDDGPLLREVRLAAIRDSPGAFAATLAHAESHDANHWDQGAEANATGATMATFFAEAAGVVVGMLGAYMMADGIVTLVGRLSAPRGQDGRVAAALLDAVADWALRSGGRSLRMWVLESDDDDRTFHERRGFRATGETMAYELDPSIREIEMICEPPEQA